MSKPKGLGDVIENVFNTLKVKEAIKALGLKDCNCDKRKDTLNKLVPFNSNTNDNSIRHSKSSSSETE